MTFTEINKDIFTIEPWYVIAHCISADMALGAGIAKMIDLHYNMKEKLWNQCQYTLPPHTGDCIAIDNVYNIITKENCYDKPTYEDLEKALCNLKKEMIFLRQKYLAMPKIGCGLDKLSWDKVKPIIKKVFDDTNINITICYLE